MVREDIERLFDLLKIYFPNSRKTGDKQLQSAWLRLLEPYSTETVQKAVTDALRGNVNFPDPQKIAVLCEAAEPAPKELAAPVDYQRRYGDTAWMAPYIRKMAANISREDAEEIRAAGLLTWGEAEKQGISFRDWNRKYREKFPVGFPESLRAVRLKNRCMDLPGSPFVKAEKKGPDLQTAVRMYPTPQARDYFPPHSPEYIAKKKAEGHGMANLNDSVGGQLNPTWVEWLMGFPLGWTDLSASEMP